MCAFHVNMHYDHAHTGNTQIILGDLHLSAGCPPDFICRFAKHRQVRVRKRIEMLSQLRNLSKAGGLAKAALSSNQFASSGIASTAVAQDKVVAVLYKAGEASKEKRLLGNQLAPIDPMHGIPVCALFRPKGCQDTADSVKARIRELNYLAGFTEQLPAWPGDVI